MPVATPVRLEETPRPAKQPPPAPRQPAILPEEPDPPAPAPSQPAIMPDRPDPAAPAPKRPAITPESPLDQPPSEHPPENPEPAVPTWWGAALSGREGSGIEQPPRHRCHPGAFLGPVSGGTEAEPCRDREESHV